MTQSLPANPHQIRQFKAIVDKAIIGR